MSFMDNLKKQQEKLKTSTGGGDFEQAVSPVSKLKNEMLVFDRDTDQHIVRVLPPVIVDENGNKEIDYSSDAMFAVGFREVFLEAKNSGGKELSSYVTLPLESDPNSYVDQQIDHWRKNKAIPNKFGNISTRFYLNVVQLFPGDSPGTYVHEVDQNNDPVVRVLKLPQSAYKEVVSNIIDPLQPAPEGAEDFGAVSPINAYPFVISRVKENNQTSYNAKMYSVPLGQLPETWVQNAEDLNALAEPTASWNSGFTNYLFAVLNGREEEFNQVRKNNDEDNFDFIITDKPGGGESVHQNVQPSQQPNFGQSGGQFNQPQQTQNQPPQQQHPQGGGQFNQPQQTQNAPTQDPFQGQSVADKVASGMPTDFLNTEETPQQEEAPQEQPEQQEETTQTSSSQPSIDSLLDSVNQFSSNQ